MTTTDSNTTHKTLPEFTGIRCSIVIETPRAILIQLAGNQAEYWFPLSQISYICRADHKDLANQYQDIVDVADWLIRKNNIKLLPEHKA